MAEQKKKSSKHIGFRRLSNRVAKEYENKGYSKDKAKEIGDETAAKVAHEKGK